MAAEYCAGAGTVCDPCYLFQDPVGSMRLVVDKNQVAVKRYDTMPFGEQISGGGGWGNGRSGTAYSPASTVKWRFGGGYKDDQNGEWPVTVMGARGLYPGYGRFDRADENLVDQGVGDPLSWNLYSYARNNPLVYSDPTGRCSKASDGKGYVDEGSELFGGKCADGLIEDLGNKRQPGVTVGIGWDEARFMMLRSVGENLSSAHGVTSFARDAGTEAISWANGAGELKLGASIAWLATRQLHHAIPKLMGGAIKQALVGLPAGLHQQFHRELAARLAQLGFPAPNQGTRVWVQLFESRPGKFVDALRILHEVSVEFDRAHGTKSAEKVIENVRLGNFR